LLSCIGKGLIAGVIHFCLKQNEVLQVLRYMYINTGYAEEILGVVRLFRSSYDNLYPKAAEFLEDFIAELLLIV